MQRELFNALFIINQDVDFQSVKNIVQKNNFTSIFILSTHFLFPEEVASLQQIIPKIRLKVKSFGDFLNEDQMVQIDRKAFEKYQSSSSINPETAYLFLKELVYFKNKVIHMELLEKFTFQEYVFWATSWVRINLGISYNYWTEQKGLNIVPLSYYWQKRLSRYLQNFSLGRASRLLILYLKMIFQVRTAYIINWNNKYFIFHSIKRLRFVKGTPIIKKKYRGFSFVRLLGKNNRNSIIDRFIKKMDIQGEYDLATPLHQFSQLYYLLDKPQARILIFVDGYRPSNYLPYAYIHYFPYGDFVCRDQFDFHLASKYNRTTLRPYSFLEKNYFVIPEFKNSPKTETIILSLNHAGDWTSLINRDDTDKLIYTFCKISQVFLDKIFIIRLHPTMSLSSHEGKNSINRIEKLIQNLNYSNLSVSENNLEQDWERGDIFITEYSLSALDAMRLNKICFFVNLTNRRSFVQDYIELGIPIAKSQQHIIHILKDIFENPSRYLNQQIKVSKKYNQDLNSFINT